MIGDVFANAGIGSHSAHVVVGGGTKEAENKEFETLKKQAIEIAKILSGAQDTVEISDVARALSQAVKNASPEEPEPEAPTQNVDAPEDDIAESPVAAPQKTLNTREGRNAAAADYNSVLEELRSQYGEAEAMRRFDEFMASEGFERVTEDSHGMRASGGLGGLGRAFTGGGISTAGMPHIPHEPLASNLSANSSLMGALVDGEVRYFAETYANYGANANQDVLDALNGLYRKNLKSAQSGTSINLAEFMKNNFGSNPQTSVVSASADLGAVAANLLEEADIELGEDGKVSFSLKEDGSGLYITSGVDDYEAAQKAIDAALRRNPDMLKAFRDEYNSVALTDTDSLGGAYNDGTHSVEYEKAERSFTYSAHEPSAVVMTDSIGVKVTGYNYQKKVSDSFNTGADFHTVNDGGVSIATWDFEANQAINRQMKEDIRKALESGEEIEGTMTRDEYDAVQTERSAGFVDPAEREAKLYSAAPGADDAEQERRASEARQTLRDLEADPRMRDREISYLDEQRKMRTATAERLLELFRPDRRTPGLNMINSIMESLRML